MRAAAEEVEVVTDVSGAAIQTVKIVNVKRRIIVTGFDETMAIMMLLLMMREFWSG